MKRKLNECAQKETEETSRAIVIKLPEQALSTLVNIVAIGSWNACSGDGGRHGGLRKSFSSLAQLIYEQAYDQGGPDAVWKNPQDGSYDHPTFPEHHGEAWEVVQQFLAECFEMQLLEYATQILTDRAKTEAGDVAHHADHYAQLLQDLVDTEGVRGLLDLLIADPAKRLD